jgi:ParB family chromosome partitioning protein
MPPRRKKAKPQSRGLEATAVAGGNPPAVVEELSSRVAEDGGAVLASYKEPLSGMWQLLVSLPIEKVQPTPYQRDLSDTHVKRLEAVIDKLGRFLDPIIAVRSEEGIYWTPNGHHRTSALRRLGAKAVIALLVPEPEVAYKILALNTEKAHNLREKSLEVVRLERDLAGKAPGTEQDYALEFEEPAFLTIGLCYEKNGRFAGGAYNSVVKRVDAFLDLPLAKALAVREKRAEKLRELDEAVGAAIAALKERGFESPYLRNFVVARVNPLRFQRGAKAEFDATIDKMIASAQKFDASKVKPGQLAAAGGAPEE